MIKSVVFCFTFTGLFVVFSFAKHLIPNNSERLAHGIIGTLAAFLTTVLFLKFDKKKPGDIGLTFDRKTMVKFITGIIAGIIVMGILVTGVLYFTHSKIHINPNRNFSHFFLMTLPLIPLAFMEELGFRAYPLEILKDKVGIRLSIIVTSILFGLYHIANGWTIASSLYGPAVWGLVFGLAAVYSKGIAMPTGIHYAANLTTSAFGNANNTDSIWTIEQTNTSTTTYEGVNWAAVLPAMVLLVFAIICIELYMRQKTTANGT